MSRSAAEVEAEVEAQRSELDRNVEALKQKMTPGQLFDEATRMAGGSGQQIAAKFVEQAKANPMPLAVMGLGLAWLMVSNNKQQTSGYSGYSSGYSSLDEPRSFAAESGVGAMSDTGGYEAVSGYDGTTPDSHGGVASGLKDKAQGVAGKASSALSGAKEKLTSGASSVGQSSRSAAHSAKQTVGNVAGAARQRAGAATQHAQQTFTDALNSEPLLIAGLGIVVGAAIGAALPATPAEDRMLGQHRDKLLNKGRDLAQTGLSQAGSAAQAAYGSVKQELKADDGRDLSEKVESAARSGVQAARDQIQPNAH
ncbi:DUF3618 domain-containing protein [Phenylobacterium deserti]|uniref:DUF3618 domain-containing protein n=1 Tax=Phenylobacterium deserti TaxID=1914756 RepID=A0A328AVU4_9CAUL|nr:DUF3618 domain-containing protein [Phenylobacterium deserti]RAK57684.1 hypothetical protein DJ018_07105 [Phenylobacterium deserti]